MNGGSGASPVSSKLDRGSGWKETTSPGTERNEAAPPTWTSDTGSSAPSWYGSQVARAVYASSAPWVKLRPTRSDPGRNTPAANVAVSSGVCANNATPQFQAGSNAAAGDASINGKWLLLICTSSENGSRKWPTLTSPGT